MRDRLFAAADSDVGAPLRLMRERRGAYVFSDATRRVRKPISMRRVRTVRKCPRWRAESASVRVCKMSMKRVDLSSRHGTIYTR